VTDATNVNAAGAIMHSDLGTKGDLAVGDGAGDVTILGVGANNYVLTADSGEASGVKWAAAGGGDTYDLNAGSKSGSNVPIQLTSGSGTDNSVINLTEGSNITLTRNSATQVTIAASGGGATAGYLTSLTGTNVNVTGYAGVFNAITGGLFAPLLVPLAAGATPTGLNDVISGGIVLMASVGAAGGVINLDHTATWAGGGGLSPIGEAFHLVFVNTDGGTYVIESTGAANLTINGATTHTNSTQYSASSLVIIAGAPQQGFAWG